MKRLFLLGLTLVLSAALLSTPAHAASFGVSLSGPTEFSDNSFSLDIAASGFADIDRLYGLEATLSYDSAKLTLQSKTPLGGTQDFSAGNKLILLNNSGLASGGAWMRLTFSRAGIADKDSATISLTSVTGSDNSNDISGGSATKVIRYVAPASNTPTNDTSKNQSNNTSTPKNSSSQTDTAPDASPDSTTSDDEQISDDYIPTESDIISDDLADTNGEAKEDIVADTCGGFPILWVILAIVFFLAAVTMTILWLLERKKSSAASKNSDSTEL